jgi:ABC-type multidrug transport system ATPase subunit
VIVLKEEFKTLASPFRILRPDPTKPFIIGRSSECSLSFKDRSVSRLHAEITFSDHQWHFKNLSQTTGSIQNGSPVQECVIEDGDEFLIGLQHLRVTLKNDELSLLHVSMQDKMDPISLSSTTPFILGRKTPENNTNGISHPACPLKLAKILLLNSKCLILFEKHIHTESGRRKKKIILENGDSIRLPWCFIVFQNEKLYIHEHHIGFDVLVKNLHVSVKRKMLLKNIQFQVTAGEILAVIGQSGQGKSTLLRVLSGNIKASEESQILINGVNYRKKKIRELLTILPQDPLVRKDFTVKETLLHNARISLPKDYSKKEIEDRLYQFTELFQLDGKEDNLVSTLSGGECRRMALSGELMGAPGLILLDEPLAGLDPVNAKILCAHLKQLSFLGHSIIITTHSYEALDIANKVLILHQGEQSFFGSPKEACLYFNSENPSKILSCLNDETASQWKTSKHNTPLSLEQSNAENIFPSIYRKSFFFYWTSLLFKTFFRDKGKVSALILQPLIIGFLLSQIFSNQSSLWIIAFALILCGNWFALSISVREIVSEKDLLTQEFRKGMPVFSLLCAKSSVSLLFSFVQITLCYLCFGPFLEISPALIPLLLIALTTLLPAIASGLFMSTISKNAGQANAFLPLLIIPQVALTGALIPLDQMQTIGRAISTIIWSRYNQNALQNLFTQTPISSLNIIIPLIIAILIYIITLFMLYNLKKSK